MFLSVLGAIAYCLITQHWIYVYIVSLQRKAQKCTYLDIRRLNAVVRALQRNPQTVLLRAMRCQRTLEGHADSSYAREQDRGYGMRGQNIIRQGTAGN